MSEIIQYKVVKPNGKTVSMDSAMLKKGRNVNRVKSIRTYIVGNIIQDTIVEITLELEDNV